jgi:hypothetical protein
MTFRRRPIARRAYPWLAENRGPSLRYELICDGAVRRYPDGREVCVDSYAGRREYLRRLELMLKRQEWRCCLCGKRIRSRDDATEGRAWAQHGAMTGSGRMARSTTAQRTGSVTTKRDNNVETHSRSTA